MSIPTAEVAIDQLRLHRCQTFVCSSLEFLRTKPPSDFFVRLMFRCLRGSGRCRGADDAMLGLQCDPMPPLWAYSGFLTRPQALIREAEALCCALDARDGGCARYHPGWLQHWLASVVSNPGKRGWMGANTWEDAGDPPSTRFGGRAWH
jgi:hypothetical protein